MTTHDNYKFGILCFVDFKPREITEQEIHFLSNLAQLVTNQMELSLVELMDERKWVERTSGRGSAFTFEIRLPQ